MVDYGTAMMLKDALKKLKPKVDALYAEWRKCERTNDWIKGNFSQSKILERLEDVLDNCGDAMEPSKRRRMQRRCQNLDKRIHERFEHECPHLTIKTLKAHNEYLIAKAQLNGLRVASKAYYLAVVDV